MICFRLLESDDPATPLAEAVATLRRGEDAESVYAVNPKSFRQVPNAPFAYWVSERIRGLFTELPPFESDGRTAKQGLATADDFRFVRTAWETPEVGTHQAWFPLTKGGKHSPFYVDVYLHVNWATGGLECKSYITQRYPYLNGNAGFVAKNTDYYFRPGLTWPARPHKRGAFSYIPSEVIFTHTGPMAFADAAKYLSTFCCLLNSTPYIGLLHILMPRGAGGNTGQTLKYEIGYVSSVPIPKTQESDDINFAPLAKSAWSLKRHLDTTNSNSHAFYAPALTPGQCTAPRLTTEPGGTR